VSDDAERGSAQEALAAVRVAARDMKPVAPAAVPAHEPALTPGPTPPPEPAPPSPALPAPPSLQPIEDAVREAARPRGPLGGLISDDGAPQRRFNDAQLRFDAEAIRYLHDRLAVTHAHYDTLLDHHRRRMDEIDRRHRLLQDDLVRHVHALSRRVDIAMSESASGRMGLDFLLRELKERLEALEDRLRRA
jgi:hypothetical protein